MNAIHRMLTLVLLSLLTGCSTLATIADVITGPCNASSMLDAAGTDVVVRDATGQVTARVWTAADGTRCVQRLK